MPISIEICPSIGTVANSLVTDVADELKPHEESFERDGVDLRFSFSETAFFTGDPAETLVIAISGGVALHLIKRAIDAVLGAIAKRKEAAKERDKAANLKRSEAQQSTSPATPDALDLQLNSTSMEYHSLTRVRVVVRDTDQNVDFAVEEERISCLSHFAEKTEGTRSESLSKKDGKA